MFRRVIYTSRSRVGADRDEIAAIVSSSTRWNEEVGVTGMLWADGQNFAQAIKGDAGAVLQTMDRIRADRRHGDIDVLLDRPVISRQFGSWSMRRAGDDEGSARGTVFMIGFAFSGTSASAERLYQIILASDGL